MKMALHPKGQRAIPLNCLEAAEAAFVAERP